MISKFKALIDKCFKHSVTGEANFVMPTTSLTVGGFNQPAVARSLIELPGNAEQGLSQRFLWLFPKPIYTDFDSLEPIKKEFTDKIGTLVLLIIIIIIITTVIIVTNLQSRNCPSCG